MYSSTPRAIACLLVLFIAELVANAQITPAKDPNATISGTVTIKGKGVPGVVVALRQSEQRMSGREFSGPKAVTDEGGNYRIANVPPGNYRIQPAAKAFVPAQEYGREKVLIVNKGDTIEHIDFAMVRGAVITGRVVDADGRPIIEEWVQVFAAPDNRDVIVPLTPLTDDRGVFRIYGLRPGSYRIAAGRGEESFQSGMPRPYRRTYHPSVSDPAQATVVEVSEGSETKDVDIVLSRRVTTFAASGQVVDAETGQPIANLAYGVTRHDERGSSSRSWGALTNSRGEFKVENLSPGKFSISMSLSQGSDLRFDEVEFEITDQNVSGLVVKARKAGSLSGVMIFEGVDEKTSREQLNNIWATASVEGDTRRSGSSVRVGQDGSFHITGLPAGTATINVYSHKGVYIKSVERDGVIMPRGITLTEREHVKGIRVVVEYGNATLRGKIDVANGTSPADGRFFVLARRFDNNTTITFAGSEGRSQVDERGQYVIEGLPSGTYEIQAGVYVPSAKSAYITKKQVVLTANSTTNVDITVDLSSTPVRP